MPRASKRVATLAVLAIAAGGLAACSSTSSSTGSTTAPTAADQQPETTVRRDAQHRRRQRPGPHRHGAGVLHPRLRARARVHQAAGELPDRCRPRPPRAPPGRPTPRRSPTPRPRSRPPPTAGSPAAARSTPSTSSRASTGTPRRPARSPSEDFLREFKAFFNPVSPVGNPGYYTSTIKGLRRTTTTETAYFANAKTHAPTAANIAAFQNSHTIAGHLDRRTRRRSSSR